MPQTGWFKCALSEALYLLCSALCIGTGASSYQDRMQSYDIRSSYCFASKKRYINNDS
jgi:hypothetical protein